MAAGVANARQAVVFGIEVHKTAARTREDFEGRRYAYAERVTL